MSGRQRRIMRDIKSNSHNVQAENEQQLEKSIEMDREKIMLLKNASINLKVSKDLEGKIKTANENGTVVVQREERISDRLTNDAKRKKKQESK